LAFRRNVACEVCIYGLLTEMSHVEMPS
jgi:hypothetical protein